MTNEILLAGFGGQGILFMGKMLAYFGLYENKEVSWLPSYGPEMRGGTANCTVKVSEKLIASPISKHPDILFTMNTPAIDKFEERLKPGGLLLVNSSIVPEDRKYRDDIKIIKIPATDIAAEVRNPKGANLVMLGALAANSDLFSVEYMESAIVSFFEKKGKGKYNEKNVACYRRGVAGK